VSEVLRGGHSKSRGQPMSRCGSTWRKILFNWTEQKEHAEDLVQLNRGVGAPSTKDGLQRAHQDRQEHSPVGSTRLIQLFCIKFAA